MVVSIEDGSVKWVFSYSRSYWMLLDHFLLRFRPLYYFFDSGQYWGSLSRVGAARLRLVARQRLRRLKKLYGTIYLLVQCVFLVSDGSFHTHELSCTLLRYMQVDFVAFVAYYLSWQFSPFKGTLTVFLSFVDNFLDFTMNRWFFLAGLSNRGVFSSAICPVVEVFRTMARCPQQFTILYCPRSIVFSDWPDSIK